MTMLGITLAHAGRNGEGKITVKELVFTLLTLLSGT